MTTFNWSSFYEFRLFTRRWQALGCNDADLRALQMDLLEDPTGWPVVPGAGGWRKARFAPPSWGAGKSGAVRVYYAELPEVGLIILGTAFAKTEASDLGPKEKKALAALLDQFREQLGGNHS